MERTDPVTDGTDERAMLAQYLDYHRATLVQKASGLTQEQLAARPVPTSELTLAGLLKHLALVEDDWFQRVMLGGPLPEPWHSAPWDDDRDWEFHTAVTDDPAYLFGLYEAACERSRQAVAAVGDLDALGAVTSRRGERFTLRWVILHMIEETARHNGHADMLREAVDGAAGE
jgi:uncharacterized damage-inducible protein DinB